MKSPTEKKISLEMTIQTGMIRHLEMKTQIGMTNRLARKFQYATSCRPG